MALHPVEIFKKTYNFHDRTDEIDLATYIVLAKADEGVNKFWIEKVYNGANIMYNDEIVFKINGSTTKELVDDLNERIRNTIPTKKTGGKRRTRRHKKNKKSRKNRRKTYHRRR